MKCIEYSRKRMADLKKTSLVFSSSASVQLFADMQHSYLSAKTAFQCVVSWHICHQMLCVANIFVSKESFFSKLEIFNSKIGQFCKKLKIFKFLDIEIEIKVCIIFKNNFWTILSFM